MFLEFFVSKVVSWCFLTNYQHLCVKPQYINRRVLSFAKEGTANGGDA